jgi:membrane associated rhomboid family serine protease
MAGKSATISGGVFAVIGLALLLFESIRALDGSTLNTLATILLYGGLGLVAVAGITLVVAVSQVPTVSDLELDR